MVTNTHKITRCPEHGCEMVTVFKTIHTELGGLVSCPECTREFRALIDSEREKREHKQEIKLDQHKRCTTCKYDKSATRAACVDCQIEIDGLQVDPTNWSDGL